MNLQFPNIALLVCTILVLCWTSTHLQAQNKTLVTGVINDQNGQVPNDPLVVSIHLGKKKLGEAVAREGLFHTEITIPSNATEQLTISTKAQSFEMGKPDKARKYGPASADRPCDNPQNIQLKVQFEYVADHPAVGPFPKAVGQ